MAVGDKESGLGMAVTVDEGGGSGPRDLSNDITSLTISLPRANQDVTGLDKSGVERILLLADLSVGLQGVFNDTALFSHIVFKTLPADAPAQLRSLSIAISSQTLTAETMPDNYNMSRAAGGAFTWSVNLLNAGGSIPAWS